MILLRIWYLDYSACFFAGALGVGSFFSTAFSSFLASIFTSDIFFDAKELLRERGFRSESALSVTRAFVIPFGAPCCFAMISLIPETANILRTAPQAMIPVPG